LIQMGMMLLPLPASSAGRWDEPGGSLQAEARRAIERALYTTEVIAALRAVLEDHPLILRPQPCAAEAVFRQPSAMADLPSPAECLLLLMPLDDAPMELEVVRDSHRLPEFTINGESRWMSQAAADALVLGDPHGIVDRYVLPPETVAAIGPGLLHRVRTSANGAATAPRSRPGRRRCATFRASGTRWHATTARGSGHRPEPRHGIRARPGAGAVRLSIRGPGAVCGAHRRRQAG
jgi:hypothetical protein